MHSKSTFVRSVKRSAMLYHPPLKHASICSSVFARGAKKCLSKNDMMSMYRRNGANNISESIRVLMVLRRSILFAPNVTRNGVINHVKITVLHHRKSVILI